MIKIRRGQCKECRFYRSGLCWFYPSLPKPTELEKWCHIDNHTRFGFEPIRKGKVITTHYEKKEYVLANFPMFHDVFKQFDYGRPYWWRKYSILRTEKPMIDLINNLRHEFDYSNNTYDGDIVYGFFTAYRSIIESNIKKEKL